MSLLDGNNRSSGNNHSNGNNCSDGNNFSNGNNYSNGNNFSNGNNCSNGNNYSNGNNRSNGNNHSDGNNWSNGNNFSNGNNCSDGNNFSNGNNWSFFNSKVLGSHESIFCYDLKGICFMAFNQQADKEKIKNLRSKILFALDGFIPFATTFKEIKEKGWHVKFDENNEYVHTLVDEDETCEKQYKMAWSLLPNEKREAVIKIIRETEWLDTEKALDVFTKITGFKITETDKDVEAAIKLLESKGVLKDGKVLTK